MVVAQLVGEGFELGLEEREAEGVLVGLHLRVLPQPLLADDALDPLDGRARVSLFEDGGDVLRGRLPSSRRHFRYPARPSA